MPTHSRTLSSDEVEKSILALSNILCLRQLGKVKLIRTNYKENDCHNNVADYCQKELADHILGYYFIVTDNLVYAILHSVVYSYYDDTIYDITPFFTEQQYHIFGILEVNPSDITKYERGFTYDGVSVQVMLT
jgi:hypothetical protein